MSIKQYTQASQTLTSCGRYIPGHIHAFYIEYVYYDRKEQAREGRLLARRAPGVYSDRVQTGGQGYGTVVQPTHY
jgi:hypothetical protein